VSAFLDESGDAVNVNAEIAKIRISAYKVTSSDGKNILIARGPG
jgi:hypothetical protein